MARMASPKTAIFILCLLPLAWLVWRLVDGGAGPNPQEFTNRFLGDWALRFLILSLALRPLRELARLRSVLSYRRMIGLYAFFYAALHLSAYLGLDNVFDWPAIWADLLKRNYISAGMVGFMMLVPLAATSSNRAIRRLKKGRWKAIHRLVYPASILVAVHYIMMSRVDIREPLVYAALIAALLAWRAVPVLMARRAKTAPSGPLARAATRRRVFEPGRRHQ